MSDKSSTFARRMNVTTENKRHKKHLTWRSWHKWVGLVFSVFIILFSVSGIILNHRHLFSHCEVSRWWLPSAYHINDWDQGIIKGTIGVRSEELGVRSSSNTKATSNLSLLTSNYIIAYGQAGVWLTDRYFKTWKEFNDGIDEGIDNRKISNVVQTSDGTLWCAALWDVYKREIKWRVVSGKCRVESGKWQKVILPGNHERISDITTREDGMVVVATRSALYFGAPDCQFKRITLKNPQGMKPQETLFKTVWMLHSGQLFGLTGQIIVDFIAIVLIILCVTGIVFFILKTHPSPPVKGREKNSQRNQRRVKALRFNLRWHNRFGHWLIILTTFVAVTGMCLRPPLMVPLVLNKTAPVPYSSMDTGSFFHDKIRAIRWDENIGLWLMSTSEGFFAFKDSTKYESLTYTDHCDKIPYIVGAIHPVPIPETPTVSPMGITVFERNPYNINEWVIGSFAGMSRWNPMTGEINNWFHDGTAQSFIPSLGGHNVTGFTADFCPDGEPNDIVFQYADAPTGAKTRHLPPMPEVLKSQPMSLWNFALELHVGRCYEPFLGSIISVLFVFVSGLLTTLILLSGYVIYRSSH